MCAWSKLSASDRVVRAPEGAAKGGALGGSKVLPDGKNQTLIRLPSAATFPYRALGAGEGFWVRA